METDPYFRLKYSWDMILCIEDFINCIATHKADLKSPRNTQLMVFMKYFRKNESFNPAGVLKDYVYLEANSFFQYAKNLKDKGDKNIPNLPTYLKKLKEFRDRVVGHRDLNEGFKSYEEWIKAHEEIQKLIPIVHLIKDVTEFYTLVERRNLHAQR